jgi:hypothetical protein
MDKLKLCALFSATFLSSGCVGRLETSPYRHRTDLAEALPGVSYALPKVRYEVKLTRMFAECPGRVRDGKPTALKFAVSVEATPSYVAGEAYTVDYEKLPGFLRTGNFDIKWWPNGTLKSIGAGAEDKTAETIGSIVKTAISVASVVGLSGGEEEEIIISPPDRLVLCKPQTESLIDSAYKTASDLKTHTATLERLEKESERMKLAGAARLLDPWSRRRFLGLFDDIVREEGTIAALKAKQEDLAGKLGATDTIIWNGGATAADYEIAYPLEGPGLAKLARLLDVGPMNFARYPTDENEKKRRSKMTACYGPNAGVASCLAQQLNLKSGIDLDRDGTKCGATHADADECWFELPKATRYTQKARDNRADAGIFVREPMTGRLLFCRQVMLGTAAPAPGEASHGTGTTTTTTAAQPASAQAGMQTNGSGSNGGTTAGSGSTGTLEGGGLGTPSQQPGEPPADTAAAAGSRCDADRDEAKIAPSDFPQFGQLRFLPLSVGPFEARELSVSLTESGKLEGFTYKSTKAPGQAMAGAIGDVASQVDAALEKRETERRDDAKYAADQEVADLTQQITLLTKQAELKKLQSPETDPLKPMLDETTAINAEVALLKAKLELAKAREAVAASQP